MISVTHAHFQLTPQQKQFRDLLVNCPTMGVLSHGEQIMATFFRSAYTGRDEPAFGLADVVYTLGKDDLTIITGWARDPFFPQITNERPRQ